MYGGASCEKRILLNVQKREFAKSLHSKNLNSLSPTHPSSVLLAV